jgi:tetratricopeptide (TPR) repeat protein
MSTLNPPKRISKRHELREDAVITWYARAWGYFDQNRKLVYAVIAGVLLVILAIIGYIFYQNEQGREAEELLGSVISFYEAGSYQEALDGTAGTIGLLEIADEYGGTDAGNLAHFYAADALYNLGEYERALEHFQEFDKIEGFIGASAIAGEAAVYENLGEYERAANRYLDAAEFFENTLASPRYLMDAARAFEAAGVYSEAQRAYEQILEDYPESNLAAQAEIYIARAQARQDS